MDDLGKLMQDRSLQEPPQIAALKLYVKSNYDASCGVSIINGSYVLAIQSAPLANNLQMEKLRIEKACNLDKPLRIRIGL